MRKTGHFGWATIAGFVIIYDAIAVAKNIETLSTAFTRGVVSRKRWQLVTIWGYLTLHLFGAIPKKLDPLSIIDHQIRSRRFRQ